jgi:hypothetical protein
MPLIGQYVINVLKGKSYVGRLKENEAELRPYMHFVDVSHHVYEPEGLIYGCGILTHKC